MGLKWAVMYLQSLLAALFSCPWMTGSHSSRVDDIMPLCGMRAVFAAAWLQVCIFESWVDPDAQHEGAKRL